MITRLTLILIRIQKKIRRSFDDKKQLNDYSIFFQNIQSIE